MHFNNVICNYYYGNAASWIGNSATTPKEYNNIVGSVTPFSREVFFRKAINSVMKQITQ